MKRSPGYLALTLLLTACWGTTSTTDNGLNQELGARYVTLGKATTVSLKWNPKQPTVTISGRPMKAEVKGQALTFTIPAPEKGQAALAWGGPQELSITDGKNTAKGTLNVLGESYLNADEPNTIMMIGANGATEEQLKKLIEGVKTPIKLQFIQLGGPGACGGLMVVAQYTDAEFEQVLTELDQRVKDNPQLALGINPVGTWVITQAANLDSQPMNANSINGAPAAQKRGLTGKGTVIAVLDTGVSTKTANEFGSRLLPGRQFTKIAQDTADTEDDFVNVAKNELGEPAAPPTGGTAPLVYGHGTGVADLAAGNVFGVAPGAEILPLKVCDKQGKCRTSDVLRGVCWAMNYADKKFNGDLSKLVMNFSLGADTGDFEKHAMKVVLESALSLRASVVASAGNQWADYLKSGLTGYPPKTYPGALTLKGLISVGSVRQTLKNPNNLEMSVFSNRGQYVDVLAPGSSVRALTAEGQETTLYRGTSFAAPQVAGAVALWREKLPSASPEEIEAKIINTANTTRVKLFNPDLVEGDGTVVSQLVTNRLLDLNKEP